MPDVPGKMRPADRPNVTRLETDDEVRQALAERKARSTAKAPSAGGVVPVAQPADETTPERPELRPPLALVCALDDGKLDGEWYRLRGDHYVLGRVEGDILIPHDGLVSGRHAELSRQKAANGFRWYLTDLQSTNGTFVRIGSSFLKHNAEILIGRGRYRFEAATGSAPTAAEPVAKATFLWAGQQGRTLVPSLVEVAAAGPVQRHPLTLAEYWIGRAPDCGIGRLDDNFASPRHARLYRDAKGQWHVENHKSLNGVWLRLDAPIGLDGACQFRLGEQRFLFRVL